jgi:SAM-dependent methyltransferase
MRSPRVRGALGAARGRAVSSGSVFSTILLTRAIRDQDPAPARRLLDVGCGASPYRSLVDADVYVGVDHALPEDGAAPGRVVGDATALPVRGGAFDAILCTEVIEHVVDERHLAAELARVAEPGAALLLTSPFVHGPHELPRDFRRLTPLGLVSVLEGAGWQVGRMTAIGGPFVVTVDSAVRWADSTARRVARHLPGGRAALAVVTRVSTSLQQGLAAAVLAHPRQPIRAIDPATATPRLTLGYVVLAERATS